MDKRNDSRDGYWLSYHLHSSSVRQLPQEPKVAIWSVLNRSYVEMKEKNQGTRLHYWIIPAHRVFPPLLSSAVLIFLILLRASSLLSHRLPPAHRLLSSSLQRILPFVDASSQSSLIVFLARLPTRWYVPSVFSLSWQLRTSLVECLHRRFSTLPV